MSAEVNSLDQLVINVSDVARSTECYDTRHEGRDIQRRHRLAPRTALCFGNRRINVRPKDADKVEWFTADHQAAGSDDLCVLTSSTPDEVIAHLKVNGVAIEKGPVNTQGAGDHSLSLLPGSRRQPDRNILVRERSIMISS